MLVITKLMCNSRVEIQIRKSVKEFKENPLECIPNSYYLNYKQIGVYVLQKFISIFRDKFLCLVWLYISPWMSAVYPTHLCYN
jgi:hypothetical protein